MAHGNSPNLKIIEDRKFFNERAIKGGIVADSCLIIATCKFAVSFSVKRNSPREAEN